MRACGKTDVGLRRHENQDTFAVEQGEKLRVADDPRLDRFGQTGPEFAVGKRSEHRHVAHHELRLRKGADHILIAVHIHPVLTPDRRIDLPQQGRRDEAAPQAAHVGRGHETRHVGNDPPADSQHEGLPIDAHLDKTTVDRTGRVKGLDRLARPDEHVFVAAEQLAVAAVDVGVGQGHHAPGGQQAGEQLPGPANVNLAFELDFQVGIHLFV